MPFTFLDASPDFDLHVRVEGPIRPEDVHAYFEELMARYGSFADLRSLIEVVGASPEGFSFRAMFKFADLTRRYEKALLGSRTALVTTSPLAYGIARMYVSTRDPVYDFAVFRSRDAALKWLNEKKLATAPA